MREALKILVTQGILEGEPHKGLHVIAIDETMIDRISEARLAVEVIAVKTLMAAPELMVELDESLDQRMRRHRDAGVAERSHRRQSGRYRLSRGPLPDFGKIASSGRSGRQSRAMSGSFSGARILSDKAISNIVQEHEELRAAILSGDEERGVRALQHIFQAANKPQVSALRDQGFLREGPATEGIRFPIEH